MANEMITGNRTIHPGLLINYTGNGKGKSTAAFGMLIRCIGSGKSAALLQFLKSPDWETGELKFFKDSALANFTYGIYGGGIHATRELQKKFVQKGFSEMKELLNKPDLHLLVLDELNIVLHQKLLPEDEVIRCLQNRNPTLHVCITGRYAPENLLKICNLVTCMEEVRHPFQSGNPARDGIDF